MIEASHAIVIATGIEDVWSYVKNISQWASLFPGCNACEVIDGHNSRWTIKVGAGGMIKTVTVLVRVDEWSGPGRVDFSFRLESEPVVGSGTYSATRRSDLETQVDLQLRVEGSGQMAPMWEAVSKPLLPQMASSFAGRLKAEIEREALAAPAREARRSFTSVCVHWLRNLWWALLGSPTEKSSRASGDLRRMEQNKVVVLSFIEAMSSSNAALADTCLARDAFTVAKGYGKFAGVRHRETMIATIDAFTHLLPTGLQLDIRSVTASGNTVVVEFEGNATTCDGRDYHNQYCMVFMLVDGKIKQVNEYFCNVHADEVLWPLVANNAGEFSRSEQASDTQV